MKEYFSGPDLSGSDLQKVKDYIESFKADKLKEVEALKRQGKEEEAGILEEHILHEARAMEENPHGVLKLLKEGRIGKFEDKKAAS